jgi:hypothetical protein
MNKNKLFPYMGFSREAGWSECAILIFAHNSKEAKKIGWSDGGSSLITDEYIDFAVNRMREDYIYKDASKDLLERGIAHVVDSPTCCKKCELWGIPMNEEGICEDCLDLINSEKEDVKD